MKPFLFSLILFWSYTIQLYSQTIPNSGFENWHLVVGLYLEPDGWQINNDYLHPVFVVQDTNAYPGNYSILLASYGRATSKFAFDKHPSKINAYVKCPIVAMTDTVKIRVNVFRNNILVDQGLWQNSELIQEWMLISIPITQNTSQSDSLEIIITGGNEGTSIMQVDDLSFDLVNDIHERSQNIFWSLKPNPVHNWATLTFNYQQNEVYQLFVYNLDGRLVQLMDNIKSNSLKIERQNFESGLYFIKLTNSKNIILQGKMIIE